jgi:hypothetical protein
MSATSSAPTWIRPLARVGYASKGVVYMVVGILAVQAAVLGGGDAPGSKGAVDAIASGAFGQVLLAIVALGLLGYVAWKLAQVVYDPDGVADDDLGTIKRFGRLSSVIGYGSVALYAAQTVIGGGGGGGGDSKQAAVAQLLDLPAGKWIVGIVGLVVIGVGIHQARRAYEGSFLDKYQIDQSKRKVARWVGSVGLASRAVVFGIIGIFVISAAWMHDASQTRGLGGALDALAAQPYGTFLLALTAIGLVAYGVHCGFKARYRQIPVGG